MKPPFRKCKSIGMSMVEMCLVMFGNYVLMLLYTVCKLLLYLV